MLCSPSCAARCSRTRFKTRGGSTRLRPPIDCQFAIVLAPGLVPAPAVHALPAIVRAPRCGYARFKTRGVSTRLRPPIDCCVRDRAGSRRLVPAPAAHALPAIVRAPAMRALRPYALQDARPLYASPTAD